MTSFLRFLRPMVLLLALGACKTDIYSNLSEQEANDMLRALLSQDIQATKTSLGEGLFNVAVGNADVADALSILESQGLPNGQRESIGQVFAKSGIVSSPFEERVRFVYALGEEVAATLQKIDGVMVARVHIVMPEDPGLGKEVKPSSAAVFIKQKPGFDLDFLMPQVRRLVANSIEGVEYDNVTVILVETQMPPVREDRLATTDFVEPLPGLRMDSAAFNQFMTYAIAAAAIVGVLILLSGFLTWRVFALRRRAALAAEGAEEDG